MSLCNFLKTYTKNPNTKDVFNGQEYEAVQIYGHIDNKDNLYKFPELLLYLYNQESDSEEPDFSKLNKTVDFLNNAGLKDFSEFEKKFGHIANDFNGFETLSDKIDAVEYLRQTYDAKIDLLESIINKDAIISSSKTKDIYASSFEIIDYLYTKNNGKSLEPLDSFIDIASQSNKFKSNALSTVSEYFNEFKTPEDKIDFYMFIKESDVSVSEFNVLTHKSIISDNDVMSNICNMSAICQEISDIDGSNPKASKEKYLKFSNLFNSFYDVKSDNTDRIKSLLRVIKKFNIKDENSMLALYNRVNSTKQHHISSSDFNYFIDLLQFDSSKTDDIFDRAKNQRISPLELLLNAEEEFEKVESEIEQILLFDETGCFAGKSPLEVYNSYKNISDKHNKNIIDVINKAIRYNMSDSAIYQEKLERAYKFSDYLYVKAIERQIPNKFVDFINSNSWVKFDKKSSKVPNIQLHARLRAIDRFALNSETSIDTLYSKETIQKLRRLFNAAYCQTPPSVKSTDQSKRLITNFSFEGSTIECVFTQQGKMITIVPKRTY